MKVIEVDFINVSDANIKYIEEHIVAKRNEKGFTMYTCDHLKKTDSFDDKEVLFTTDEMRFMNKVIIKKGGKAQYRDVIDSVIRSSINFEIRKWIENGRKY